MKKCNNCGHSALEHLHDGCHYLEWVKTDDGKEKLVPCSCTLTYQQVINQK